MKIFSSSDNPYDLVNDDGLDCQVRIYSIRLACLTTSLHSCVIFLIVRYLPSFSVLYLSFFLLIVSRISEYVMPVFAHLFFLLNLIFSACCHLTPPPFLPSLPPSIVHSDSRPSGGGFWSRHSVFGSLRGKSRRSQTGFQSRNRRRHAKGSISV